MSLPYGGGHRCPPADGHRIAWTNVHESRDPRARRRDLAGAVEPDGGARIVAGLERAKVAELANPVGKAALDGGLGIIEVRAGDAEELGIGVGAG